MTHSEFDLNLEKVKSGRGAFLIPTAYRCIIIDSKCISRFAKNGHECIKKEKGNNGFYIARGKHFDYVFADYLRYSDYAK
jgi:hypothetical protein